MFDDEDEDKSVVPSIEERFQHLVLAASCLGKLKNIFKLASVASMTSDVKMSQKKKTSLLKVNVCFQVSS